MNKVKLSWLFNTISSGTTPPSNKDEYYDNGTINWLNTGDLNDGFVYDIPKKVTFKALGDFSTLKIYKPNSIVMAMYGATIGKLGIINQEFCTNQACVVLSNPKKNVNFKFIYYCLISKREDIINKANGGGQPNISQSIVKNIRIGVPDKKSQEMIAEFLDKKLEMINDLIQSKKTQIELLEEQRQAMITEAVTKGLNPNAKMKDSGVEWIGDIPEHWEMCNLKRVLAIRNGKENDSNSEIEGAENSVPVYGSGGIFKWTNKKLYSGDSILFGRKGTIGKPIRVNRDFWTVDTMYYSIPKMKESSGYLFYLLCIYPWKLITTNTALPSIVGTDLGEQKICFPNSKQELRSIEIFLINKDSEIKKLVSRIELQLDKLKEYRQSLIHEAVTGKIPIEEMESYLKEVEKNGG